MPDTATIKELRRLNDRIEAEREEYLRHHHLQYLLACGDFVGFFPDRKEAYFHAVRNFSDDSIFLIRQCLRKDEERPAIFRSGRLRVE